MVLTLEEAKKMMERNVGSLDLRNTPITQLPDNLTVGDWLDLSGTQITHLPDNLTVGGGLDLSGTQITDKSAEREKVKKLHDGEYVAGRYLYADGILTHVKKKKKAGKYTLYIGKIKGRNVVSDGEHYAHCDSIREGIADLLFKQAKDRGAEQYRGLTLDSVVTIEEAATMYRVITGACRQGTENFIKSLKEPKETYTIRECIDLTRGQYNAERFEGFFN